MNKDYQGQVLRTLVRQESSEEGDTHQALGEEDNPLGEADSPLGEGDNPLQQGDKHSESLTVVVDMGVGKAGFGQQEDKAQMGLKLHRESHLLVLGGRVLGVDHWGQEGDMADGTSSIQGVFRCSFLQQVLCDRMQTKSTGNFLLAS